MQITTLRKEIPCLHVPYRNQIHYQGSFPGNIPGNLPGEYSRVEVGVLGEASLGKEDWNVDGKV